MIKGQWRLSVLLTRRNRMLCIRWFMTVWLICVRISAEEMERKNCSGLAIKISLWIISRRRMKCSLPYTGGLRIRAVLETGYMRGWAIWLRRLLQDLVAEMWKWFHQGCRQESFGILLRLRWLQRLVHCLLLTRRRAESLRQCLWLSSFLNPVMVRANLHLELITASVWRNLFPGIHGAVLLGMVWASIPRKRRSRMRMEAMWLLQLISEDIAVLRILLQTIVLICLEPRMAASSDMRDWRDVLTIRKQHKSSKQEVMLRALLM